MNYYKKVGILRDKNGKILGLFDIVECLNKEEYLSLKEEAKKNYNNIVEKDRLEKENLQNDINSFKNDVNSKLEKYHKILYTLVKENE